MAVNAEATAPVPEYLQVIGDSKVSQSFLIGSEDHTLGNVLRHILVVGMEKDVEFAGYSVPHPSEDIMQMRVQLTEDSKYESGAEALSESARVLAEMCSRE